MPSTRSPGSPISARAAARRPAPRSSTHSGGLSKSIEPTADEHERAEHTQLIEDLKQQLQRAEIASEHYQKELELAKIRLNEVTEQRDDLEDQITHKDMALEAGELNVKEILRQQQDVELSLEAEKKMLLDERDDQRSKEQELQDIIYRLNETIRCKEERATTNAVESSRLSTRMFLHSLPCLDSLLTVSLASLPTPDSPDYGSDQVGSSARIQQNPSRNSKVLSQKDRLIEELRMELVDVQIKLAELEHTGDGRVQVLEKELVDIKMANARLMEDNESFQLLLSEKTLKGDFLQDARPESAPRMGTLAEELETAGDGGQGESSDAYKRLETELRAARESNKALTLYVDKIIGRLLQHEGAFERILHDKEPGISSVKTVDKALPPPPPSEEQGSSLLQRAKSVVSGRGGGPAARARPMSYMPPPSTESVPTAHEHPDTAPSIPLGRGGHRRSRSDQANEGSGPASMAGSASPPLSGQVHRASPLRTSSGGRTSPDVASMLSGGTSLNHSLGAVPSNTPSSRPLHSTGPSTGGRSSRANSVLSMHSGEITSQDPPSPPRDKPAVAILPGAVMKQNQLRPLRLVRQNTSAEDEEIARKKANRGSWMPAWFNRGPSVEGESIKPT